MKEIVNSVKIGSFIPWEQVAYYMETRTRAQCVTRWSRIDTAHKSGRWTPEEDALLLAMVKQFGPRSYARERLVNALLTNVGKWTEEEDKVLMDAVEKYGAGAWSRISGELSGRAPSVVKNRYRTIMRYRERGYDSPLSPKKPPKKLRSERKNSSPGRSGTDSGDGDTVVARDKVVRHVDDTLAELQRFDDRTMTTQDSETEGHLSSDDSDVEDSPVAALAPLVQKRPLLQNGETTASATSYCFPQGLDRKEVAKICTKLTGDFQYDNDDRQEGGRANVRSLLRKFPRSVRSQIKNKLTKVVDDYNQSRHANKRKQSPEDHPLASTRSNKRIKSEAVDPSDALDDSSTREQVPVPQIEK